MMDHSFIYDLEARYPMIIRDATVMDRMKPDCITDKSTIMEWVALGQNGQLPDPFRCIPAEKDCLPTRVDYYRRTRFSVEEEPIVEFRRIGEIVQLIPSTQHITVRLDRLEMISFIGKAFWKLMGKRKPLQWMTLEEFRKDISELMSRTIEEYPLVSKKTNDVADVYFQTSSMTIMERMVMARYWESGHDSEVYIIDADSESDRVDMIDLLNSIGGALRSGQRKFTASVGSQE